MFARDGYDAVGVADLCARLGVKPPSLYAAYGSKRALFEKAVSRYGAQSAAAYGTALDDAVNPVDLKRRVLETALDLYLADGPQGCLVLANLSATADAEIRAALAAIVSDRQATMAGRARALGASPAEAEALVSAISVAMMGLSAAVRAGMDRASLQAALHQLL